MNASRCTGSPPVPSPFTITVNVIGDLFKDSVDEVVEPMNEAGAPSGKSFLAVDRAQAGEGDTVLVMSEGNGVRQLFKVEKTADLPIRSVIVGIVDEVANRRVS